MIHLILGGARSGKSNHALKLDQEDTHQLYFIATAEAVDDEFSERIHAHQQERDARWQTIEAPIELTETLITIDDDNAIVVVDCLTVWLGNLLHHQLPVDSALAALMTYLPTAKSEIRFVSNELGLGLVPESSLGREFRDLQGRLNQQVASAADQVELLIAGIPMKIKP